MKMHHRQALLEDLHHNLIYIIIQYNIIFHFIIDRLHLQGIGNGLLAINIHASNI